MTVYVFYDGRRMIMHSTHTKMTTALVEENCSHLFGNSFKRDNKFSKNTWLFTNYKSLVNYRYFLHLFFFYKRTLWDTTPKIASKQYSIDVALKKKKIKLSPYTFAYHNNSSKIVHINLCLWQSKLDLLINFNTLYIQKISNTMFNLKITGSSLTKFLKYTNTVKIVQVSLFLFKLILSHRDKSSPEHFY